MITWQKTIFIFLIVFSSVAFAYSHGEGLRVYKKDLAVSTWHQLKLAEDIDRYKNADDLWEVLRHDFSLHHYENNPLVRQQIYWFLTHQEFLRTSATRSAPYLYYILQQARKRHLPAEVVLLPMIESAFNPFAYSSAGAAGIWQMMPGTANGYGIKQNWWYDGRRDIITSTQAALNHLAYLVNFFKGNWLLAFAAYDTGEGNVMSAVNRNLRAGRRTDYWSLPLAQETRDYVPRLLALAAIIASPDRYPVSLPPVHNAPYLAQIDVGKQMDLKYAAGLAGITLKSMLQLNPGYNRASTDPHGPFKIVLPIHHVAQFAKNLDQLPLTKQPTQHYKVRSGETVISIAKRFKTTPSVIRKSNQLAANHLKTGAELLIPHTATPLAKTLIQAERNGFLASKEFSPTTPYQLKPGDTVYMARKGDTLHRIANRFHTSPLIVGMANNLKQTSVIKLGQRIIIPTHAPNKPKIHIEPGDTLYMVRKGDTMEKIAKRFHTTVPHLHLANLLSNNKLIEGDSLVIPARG